MFFQFNTNTHLALESIKIDNIIKSVKDLIGSIMMLGLILGNSPSQALLIDTAEYTGRKTTGSPIYKYLYSITMMQVKVLEIRLHLTGVMAWTLTLSYLHRLLS